MQSIRVEHISKQYRVGRQLPRLHDLFRRAGVYGSNDVHWAIHDISFNVHAGKAFGIIGPNGAGKTTILKILSRITAPTSGKVHVAGRLSALIELGAGFHPELTGRENIFLNATILGMRKSEIKKRFSDIVDFAELSEYLDTPVKRYSSGMYARLGFAIAAHLEPVVLLVDEVLAVGDYAFQQKCYARMDELRSHGTALIFVSHNFEAIRRVCDQCLVLYKGKAIFQGDSAEAIMTYSNAMRSASREAKHKAPLEEGLSQRVMTFEAEIVDVRLEDVAGQPISIIETGTSVTVVLEIVFHKSVSKPIFSLIMKTPDGTIVYDTTTRWMNIQTPNFCAGERCRVKFILGLPLLDGEYLLSVDVAASDFSHYYDQMERALSFYIISSDGAKGLANLAATVRIERLGAAEREIPAVPGH
jgi:ABC-type polysaccharide/polyol phosphate transport system ATPase subunit